MPFHNPLNLQSLLNGKEALKLLEIINKTMSCKTEQDFRELFPNINELFPFDFAGVIAGRIDDCNELVISHGINISFPEEWLRQYISNNYFHFDVATKETLKTCKPRLWSYLQQEAENIPDEIRSLDADFGINNYFTHGASSSIRGENGSAFCFTVSSVKCESRATAVIERVVPHLHAALCNISCSSQPGRMNVRLSDRQKEVLNWLKQGKSSWDISVILRISESTVNFHIYNIMKKLGAANRPQAVAVAASLGLIDFY